MSSTDKTNVPLDAAYDEYDRNLRRRSVIIADAVALVCMPAGILLDLMVYPEMVGPFLAIRLGVDAILLVIVLVMFATRHLANTGLVVAAGIVSTLVVNLSFCLMIAKTEGALSPYYAGINLVILIMATFLPWKAWETLLVCLVSLFVYALVCVAHPNFDLHEVESVFFNNCYFIVITAVICVTSTWFRSRGRFEEFRLRHQLDVQNRQLQDLDRIKTRFFSNVSHELRTPLTLILGPVESLLGRGEGLEERVHSALILVHRNTLRLLKLINDLLELTRLDQGAELLRSRTFAAGPFIKGIVESVRHLGLAKQIRIKTTPGPDALPVYGDPARLEKVLLNLLTNAIKYTSAGGSVEVGWAQAEEGFSMWVADTGVGIPAEDLERIFDRFHQVRSNAANQVQGVGIGLSLAKEIVEQHHGRIEVRSRVGEGSTFTVFLPAGREEESDDVPESMTPAGEEPFEKAFRSADRTWRNPLPADGLELPAVGTGEQTVLVADDEVDMLQYVVSVLSEDYRVVQTRTGSNVADLVAEHEPALVVLDWMMPGKDGLTVCRELRQDERRRDLKIVLLTARIDEKSKLQALEAGADDFLTKPFSTTEVRTRIANLIRSGRLQADLRRRNEELSDAIRQLRETEAMLIQSEKMNAVGSLSAGLLHEINNPLNYTLTAIGIANAQGTALTPMLRELLADVEEGMSRIRDVVTNLRSFAYPEKPGTESRFSPSEAIEAARRILAAELRDVEFEENGGGQILMRGQKTQMTHLFMNLFSNAAKAMERARSPVRRIRVDMQELDGALEIRVSDSGPGIPPDALSRVFEPFFTTAEVGSGLGMGLSICHTIVSSHGGRIRAENTPGGGAAVLIEIPTEKPTEIHGHH